MGNGVRKVSSEDIKAMYAMEEQLGQGSFAVVKKAIRKSDNRVFAIKIVDKRKLNPEELSVIHDEVMIMYKIDHRNCVRLYEIFETSKKLYMVLDYLQGGELFDHIVARGSYSEKEASVIVRDVASALQYLHGIGIVHRDLKPENLLYTDKTPDAIIKITDFGLAKFKADRAAMTTGCGTPGYVAPEVLRQQPYLAPVDMWSLGVITYILLCGFPPFYDDDTRQLYAKIKKGSFTFPAEYWGSISKEAKHLITGLLTVDPMRRLTPQQVLDHPWIRNNTSEDKTLSTDMMKRAQARKKLREATQLVLAANRLADMFPKKG